MKATKIVATLGPASDTVDIIAAMIEAGCDVFRLNFSHGTAEVDTIGTKFGEKQHRKEMISAVRAGDCQE